MKMTRLRINRLRNKIRASRTRLMQSEPFIALVLMHLGFAAVRDVKTISTNGRYILFSADYLDKLYNTELDFLLCHQVLHIVFGDTKRHSGYAGDTYHHACDIFNNSILEKCGFDSGRYPHLGQIYKKIPKHLRNESFTTEDIYNSLIYDLSVFDERTVSRFMIDTDKFWDKKIIYQYDYITILPPDDDETENARYSDDDIGSAVFGIMGLLGSGASGLAAILKERMRLEFESSKSDWRTILNDFVQEEINDYSFAPPDRRFCNSPFFLPDFNEKDEIVKNVLFMIDTSGSMSDEMITDAYSEIKGAIDQYNGKLQGMLGFFDAAVVEPKPFASEEEFRVIHPVGGGGTSFGVIFEYVNKNMADEPPASIIILTDGYAPFPKEAATNGIPVLWMINNEDVTPPWGKVARI